MSSWAWVLIIAAAVVVLGLIAAVVVRQRRTTALREQFGSEYDRTVAARDNRRGAETELRNRAKQRAQLDVRPLPEATRTRFAAEWSDLQQRFVDQPSNAVIAAEGLVTRVMSERGYPVEEFDAQSDLISVDHPQVVENYRTAHDIYGRAQTQRASTEDLREAMLRYRSLFDELLVAGQDSGESGDRGDTGMDSRTDEGSHDEERNRRRTP
jgi:hypothetical protein